MTVTGIIAEYNPFHSGHAYHLAEARRLTGADFLVVVMSGDFVQRGEPALFSKYLRAAAALESGADLVLELPTPFATAGGPDFAGGAVSILSQLGCVDYLVFGSESGQISSIWAAADVLDDESDEVSRLIQRGLKQGLSYPAAVAQAVSQCTGHTLSTPNNLLGVEYCRAIKRIHSSIEPVTIRRLGGYHDQKLSAKNSDTHRFASASALRQAFAEHSLSEAIRRVSPEIPASSLELIKQEAGHFGPLFVNDFTDALFYRLLSESEDSLSRYLDVTPELSNRIFHQLPLCTSCTELAETVKCKAYTRLRINRALLHSLLTITDEDMTLYKENDYTHYARVLGLKENARPLLKEITEKGTLSLLLRMKEDKQRLNPTDQKLLAATEFASDLYRMTAQRKFGAKLPDEYGRRLIKR